MAWFPSASAVLVIVSIGFASPGLAQNALVGTWRGTSTCADEVAFPACKDEIVIYTARPLVPPADSVLVQADKIVNGVREEMGELRYGRDSAGAWRAEFKNARVHLLWTLRIDGDLMTGTLTDLPSGRLARRVSLRRAPNEGR